MVAETVITLWQPFALLMVLGLKRIETRSWMTGFRGRLWIHAAGSEPRDCKAPMHESPIRELLAQHGYHGLHELPRGAILGRVELYFVQRIGPAFLMPDLRECLLGDYRCGRYAWFMRGARRLAEPIAHTGQRGMWHWTPPAGLQWAQEGDSGQT